MYIICGSFEHMLVIFFEKTEVLFLNWKGLFTATILPKSKYILGNEII